MGQSKSYLQTAAGSHTTMETLQVRVLVVAQRVTASNEKLLGLACSSCRRAYVSTKYNLKDRSL